MIFRKIVDVQKPDALTTALDVGTKVAAASLAGGVGWWYLNRRREKDVKGTVTDMSFLNPTKVKMRIPETVSEVQDIVKTSENICIRGSAHSMGGHTLWPARLALT